MKDITYSKIVIVIVSNNETAVFELTVWSDIKIATMMQMFNLGVCDSHF